MYKEIMSTTCYSVIQSYLHQLMLCHSAFEANNNTVYSNVINTLVKNSRYSQGIIFFYGYSAHDCTSIIEIIKHMRDGKLIIRFGNCGLRHNQVDLLCKVLQKHKRIKVEELSLENNKLESVENLFSGAQNSFQSLLDLNLDNTMINTVKFLEHCYMLEGVDLSNNPLGISGMRTMQAAVAGGSLTNLEYLYLQNALAKNASGNIDSVAFWNILKALSAHCPHLRELDVSLNNLGQAGAVALAKIKSQHNEFDSDWLSELRLNRTKLGDDGLYDLIKTLNVSSCIHRLHLCGNDIHAIGVRYLVEAIQSGKVMTKFDSIIILDDNPLGYEGLIEIGKMLSDKNYDSFTSISLSNFQLTDSLTCNDDASREIQIGQQLYQMHPNLTVSRFYLDNNRFTGDSIHILVGFMCLCRHLEILATRNCAMSSSDFNQLCDKLVQLKSSGGTSICGKLRRWLLDGNRIGDEGASTLIKHRPSSLFPKVRKATKDTDDRYGDALVFCGNPISDEMIEALSKELNNGQEYDSDGSRECTKDISESENELSYDTDSNDSEENSSNSIDSSESEEELLLDEKEREEIILVLDQVLDFANDHVPLHLGQIADSMYEWEGPVAEHLGLTQVDVAAIKLKHPGELKLQTRGALQKWKQKLGSRATYRELIDVFMRAGYEGYVDAVRKVVINASTGTKREHESIAQGPPQAKRSCVLPQ